MDLTKDQFKKITELIQLWFKDPTFELETTFGPKGTVDSNTFLQIAQRLRTKEFEVIPQDDRLSIITPNNIRISLQGLGLIESYCKDNSLQGKPFTAMIKERIGNNAEPIHLPEYDIRFKIRRELDLSNNDPRITQLLKTWNTQAKAFRMIRRWSFKGKGIRIDMSMIRQSQIQATGEFKWTSTFLDANILRQMTRYEVEVELLHENMKESPEDAMGITLRALIAGVGEVQRAIQKNSLLIRKSVMQSVRAEYASLVKSDKFRGVGPVTLEVQNMDKEINEAIPNIRTGFNVTDKADGMRTMGFINSTGDFYLIDQSMTVYRTGLQNDTCANSLVDGEWITSLKDGTPVNRYLIFDIYIYNRAKVSQLPFITTTDGQIDREGESRYVKLNQLFDKWIIEPKVTTKGVTEATLLIIACKQFKFGNGNQIFEQCATMLDREQIYNTDGLILTSNSEPLPDKFGGRFNMQFKWKPSKDNTIDFLVLFESDESGDKIFTSIDKSGATTRYKTMRLYVGGLDNKSPRTSILNETLVEKEKPKYRPILFQPQQFGDLYANFCNVLVQNDPDTFEEYAVTEHTHEPIQNRSIVEMRYVIGNEAGWCWIPTRIRHDKTERYVRAIAQGGDIKYTGMMNDEGTANSVWNSIHDPVTESMIRTGNEEPSERETATIATADITKTYYEKKAPKEEVAGVSGLRDFHNKYIKNEILIKSVLQPGNKRLLDITCGVGGDLNKWVYANASYVMGIDIAENNIINPQTGAYSRYAKMMLDAKKKRLPKIAFAVGDSSKSIVNGDAGSTPEERDMMRAVFGKVEPEGAVPPYITNVMKNSFREGADVVSCMFAIHYFFKNKDTLDGLLKNLADTVKIGGYFVGCCFDGETVFRLLESVEKNESVTGTHNDVQLWKIKKEYDQNELTDDDSSIGLPIHVDFISIGNAFTEYLVSFPLLVAKFREIGLELLSTAEANRIGLQHSTAMFQDSYEMAKKGKHNYVMPDAVKDYSFLNRWFIFVRRQELPGRIKDTKAVTKALSESRPGVYRRFEERIIDADPSYAKFLTVDSSDYSVLQPWHRSYVKNILKAWFPSTLSHIVDATAHIGVDSIYLSDLFPGAKVDAYEVVPNTFEALKINIQTFDKEDFIVPHLQDISLWDPSEPIDLLFVDPPWGGRNYKKVKKLNLYLQAEGEVPNESKNIKTILKKWLSSGYIKTVVLKVPTNFDLNDLPPYNLQTDAKVVYNATKTKKDYVLMIFRASPEILHTAPALTVDEEKVEVPAVLATVEPEIPVAAAATKSKKSKPNVKPEKEFKFGKGQLNGGVVSDEENIRRWNILATTSDPIPVDQLPSNASRWLDLYCHFEVTDVEKTPTLLSTIGKKTTLLPNYEDILRTYLSEADKSRSKVYPLIAYYLCAMKLKFASTKPSDSKSMMYDNKIIAAKLQTVIGKEQYSNDYFEALTTESLRALKTVSEDFLLAVDADFEKKYKEKRKEYDANPKSSKAPPERKRAPEVFEDIWQDIKSTFIDFVFKQRLEHDSIFQKIMTSLTNENYTLTYTGPAERSTNNSSKKEYNTDNAYFGERIMATVNTDTE